jgi:hypothetical protein
MHKRTLVVFLALLATLLLLRDGALAADLVVPRDVPTVEDAITRLQDGDRIILLPGDYVFAAQAPDSVGFSIIGRGGRDSTRVKGSAPLDAILSVEGGEKPFVVRGLTFDRTAETNTYSILAKQRAATVEECRFLGGAGAFLDSCKGVVRGNEFRGCFDGLRLQGSPVLVDRNEFTSTLQYPMVVRGSAARIERNVFKESGNACILIVGKHNVPVIGGSRPKANFFLQNKHLLVANQSRNGVDARFNYWGAAVTSSMDRLGYPAAVEEIHDKWDQDDRAAGMVDYRNWLRSAEEARKPSYGRPAFLAAFVLLSLGVLVTVIRLIRRPRPA